MTAEEIQKWETHPYRGMQMLQSGPSSDTSSRWFMSITKIRSDKAFHNRFAISNFIHSEKFWHGRAVRRIDITRSQHPGAKNGARSDVYIEHTMKMPFNKEVFRALRRSIEGEQAAS